jgi:DNA modification methylase
VGAGLERIGFVLRQQIIWVKPFGIPSRTHYSQREPCWYAVRKDATAEWLGDTRQTTVLEAPSPKMMMGGSDEAKFDHPTQKPSECMARPIRNHRGDVYEPFAGSGTMIIAAETFGRRCYALEIEPRYVQVAIERWQGFTGREVVRVDG